MSLGFITMDERGAADQLLAALVQDLVARGVPVAGMVAHDPAPRGCEMSLALFPGGPVVDISQDLGVGADACTLDPGALEQAVAEITQLQGYELKRIMRTGTVATIDNRNWELRDPTGPVQRLSQSRAVALDMESATIAANGFRFRVPYGTLLCVSDKPLHGELKLPGMASDFYRTQVSRHLEIGIRAMELLRDMPLDRIHSRKLRSFEETAFL